MKYYSVIFTVALATSIFLAKGQEKKEDKTSEKEKVGTVIGIDLGTTYSW